MSEIIDPHAVFIRDAAFPKPFSSGLQYSCPVHNQWNIVHIGSLLPESHAVYVCGDNCLRGVVMTAAEMGLTPHFSAVMPDEQEMADGRLEEVTIQGTAELIRKLPERPKAILLFLVCMHHFVGADEHYIFHELERQFPDICFLRCWMDPVMQKLGPTPDMKLRREMLSPLKNQPRRPGLMSLVADNLRLPEESDLLRLFHLLGIPYRQLQDMRTFSDYRSLGEASLLITRSPAAEFGLRKFADETKRPYLYLPPKLCFDEIREELEKLLMALLKQNVPAGAHPDSDQRIRLAESEKSCAAEILSEGDEKIFAERMAWLHGFCAEEEQRCEAVFDTLSPEVRQSEISLDGIGLVQPLSCARLLISHGLHVRHIYLDVFLPEEKEDFDWLQKHVPELEIHPIGTVEAHAHVKALTADTAQRSCAAIQTLSQDHEAHPMRSSANAASETNRPSSQHTQAIYVQTGLQLCLGPAAALFQNSRHFINKIENGGAWGYQAVRQLLSDMEEAVHSEKSTEDLVQRKGLGLPSVVDAI